MGGGGEREEGRKEKKHMYSKKFQFLCQDWDAGGSIMLSTDNSQSSGTTG